MTTAHEPEPANGGIVPPTTDADDLRANEPQSEREQMQERMDDAMLACDAGLPPVTEVEQLNRQLEQRDEEYMQLVRNYDSEVERLQEDVLKYCRKWEETRERLAKAEARATAAETAAAQDATEVDGYAGLLAEAQFGKSYERFVAEHSQWADETFTTQTIDGVIAHLKREAQEVINAQTVPDVISESVDVFMLAINLCHKTGFDFLKHVWRKFDINKTRKWGERDSEGVPVRERSAAATAPQGERE
jgi:hypothetical protein